MRTPLEQAVRECNRRCSMHPHKPRPTQAGPARHVPVGRGENGKHYGLLWVGMRNHPPVRIEMFEDPRPPRMRYDFVRWMAVAKYRRDKYSRDLMNALTDAWRC